MRQGTGVWIFAIAALWTADATADPVTFQPAGCDFQVSFPAAPTVSQTSTQTDRNDTVVNDKATLSMDVDGNANYFRAECTVVPHMGFVDEAILNDNMLRLGETYKLQNVSAGIEHSGAAGPIGRLRGKGRVGGKDMIFEIRRYTSKTAIFDVWIGTDPDSFPSAADSAFLKSVKLDGQDLR
jgi:hypothetical protein